MLFRIFLMAFAVLAGTSAAAATPNTPHEIVTTLYKPYLADPHAQNASQGSATDLIRPYASVGLKAAIAKDEACARRSQGICNLDADILINGQDWDLSQFRVEDRPATADRQVIVAHFLNDGLNTVSFFFIKEKADWRIDEVEAIRFKSNGSTDQHWKLKETLSR